MKSKIHSYHLLFVLILLFIIPVAGCGDDGQVVITPTATPVVIPVTETISLASRNIVAIGNAVVNFPAGSVNREITCTGSIASVFVPADINSIGSIYNFTLSDNTAYNPYTAEITITFEDTLSADGLQIYRSSDGINWESMGGTLNTSSITAEVPGFSYFVLGRLAGTPETVYIEGGTFTQGKAGSTVDGPAHQVVLGSFYMGKYDITNSEFCLFLNEMGNKEEPEDRTWIYIENMSVPGEDFYITGGPAPGTFAVKDGYENYPAVNISWYGAVAYCNWLSEKHGLDKCYGEWTIDGSGRWGVSGENFHPERSGYRLPTESEWEYACRAGTTTDFFWGENFPPTFPGPIDNYCWHSENSNYDLHAVNTLQPNPWGLYHMGGNAWNWCNDWYSDPYENDDFDSEHTYFYNHSTAGGPNPIGPPTGEKRILRSGSAASLPYDCSSYKRNKIPAYVTNSFISFRVVKTK